MAEEITDFSAWLSRAMRHRGFVKQIALAKAANVAQSTVSSYLSGARVPEKPEQVEKLARALAPIDAEDHTFSALMNSGLLAAGLAPKNDGGDAVGQDGGEHRAVHLLRQQPDSFKDFMLRVMEAGPPYAAPAATETPLPPGTPALAAALQRQVRAADPRLRGVVSVTWALDMDGRFMMSEGPRMAPGDAPPGEVVGLRIEDVYKDCPDFLEKVRMVLASDGPLDWTTTVRGQPYRCRTEPLRDAQGNKIGLVGTSFEVPADQVAARDSA